jgi:hypothetical protein
MTEEGKTRLIDSALHSVRWCKRKLGHMLLRTILRNRSMNAVDITDDFVEGTCGHEYEITKRTKRSLLERFDINNREIQSGTSTIVHVILAREILSIPRHVKGDVVECGCWNGASTASLSLACRLTSRRLLVCFPSRGPRLIARSAIFEKQQGLKKGDTSGPRIYTTQIRRDSSAQHATRAKFCEHR